jgi:hypothetical protein
MGMYDTVIVPCPKCQTKTEFQTKSGECTLAEYTLEDVPEDVLGDINRHAPATCRECGVRFHVKLKITATPEVWPNDEEED